MQNKKPKCYLPHEYIYNSSGSKHSFYKTMFIEDIMNKIIPISLERNKDDCKAVLDCCIYRSIRTAMPEFNRTLLQ